MLVLDRMRERRTPLLARAIRIAAGLIATTAFAGAQFLPTNTGVRVYWSPGARCRFTVRAAGRRSKSTG